MGTTRPLPIPWPASSFPGASVEESAGRLINCHAEQLGDPADGSASAPNRYAWHRNPGLSQHATTAQSGYRGGLIVGALSYETWANEAATVDTNGTVVLLGSFPGTKKVSLARNQKAGSPDVVAVDIDNGAYQLSTGGAPASYNGGGNLPQPKSVCFQDGYFIFLTGNCLMYASGINALTQNAATFVALQAKASVTGQRCIAYSGLLLGFTTASCEIWQDTAQPAPGFPYSRLAVLEFGLVQENAIAGFEEGFSTLIWVAQDYGVYVMLPGSLSPQKISPPDLDRLIEAQVKAGNLLDAGCYAFAGKKFWTLSSPAWTFEFNINTLKWHERWSLQAALGIQGRWRGTGGHPAFGKWLLGDTQSGNLLYVDDTNYTENGAPQLFRMESGPVVDFPNRMRVARADFNFVTGVGTPGGTPNPQVAISWSNDNGNKWLNPILRSLGAQGNSKTTRISVKNTGQSGPQGRRWRIDVSDAVYTSFMGATQSTDPRDF